MLGGGLVSQEIVRVLPCHADDQRKLLLRLFRAKFLSNPANRKHGSAQNCIVPHRFSRQAVRL